MYRPATLLLFSARPIRGAKLIKSTPRWLAPFLLLAGLLVVIAIAAHPFTVADTLQKLPLSADKGEAVEILDQELFMRSAILPFRLIAGWGSFALLLFYFCMAFRPPEKVRFAQILALEVHAECTSVYAHAVALAWTAFSEVPGEIQHRAQQLSLASIIGPGGDFVSSTLLATLNIFTFWYLVLLAAGVSVLCGFRKFQAFLIVAAVWTVSAGINIGILKLLKDTMHLLV